jgi:hypothetical protein
MDTTQAHLLTDKEELDVEYYTRQKTLRRRVIGAVVICLAIVCAVIVTVYFTVFNSPAVPVSNVACSGNGYMQVDNLAACVCVSCRTGPDCSEVVEDCAVDINSGQPRVMQGYWANAGLSTDAVLPPYFKPFYGDTVPSLPDAIRNLHAMVGNANAANKTIILGYGGTHMLFAAVYAINTLEGRPMTLFSPAPHYSYASFAAPNGYGYFNSSLYLNESDVVEIVTAINNPTCDYRSKYYTNAKYYIHDMVYYWPSYAEINVTLDEEIMIFSASKFSGHAGNRMGWALVKDPVIAQLMQRYISMTTFGYSTDLSQKFQLIFNHVISTRGEIFAYAKAQLASRYVRLLEILAGQPQPPRFTLASQVGGFYLFMRCNLPQDANCYAVFSAGGITGRAGYGVGPEYVRFNFMMFDTEAEIFFTYLTDLIHAPQNLKKRLPDSLSPVISSDDYWMLGC